MNIQNYIDSVMQYESIGAIISGAFIVICCICAAVSKKQADTKGGYSLLVLCVISFAVMYLICNVGQGAQI